MSERKDKLRKELLSNKKPEFEDLEKSLPIYIVKKKKKKREFVSGENTESMNRQWCDSWIQSTI